MQPIKRTLNILIPVAVVLGITSGLLLLIGADLPFVIGSFFGGLFGSTYQIGEIFVKATPLMLAGLGCSIGFTCGFINLGAEGQLYMGALASSAVAIFGVGLPHVVLIVLMGLAGFLAGGLWGLVPGFMKARFGLSEVIMGLMFNYIAIQLNALSIRTWLKDPNYAFPMSSSFPDEAHLSLLLPRTRLHTGILIAIVLAFLLWVFLWKSARGFQIRACGSNPRASFCVGINVNRNLILSALISGGLAGLAGFVEVAGVQHKLMDGISSNYGYLAVMVSLLGRNHPLGVVLAASFFGALNVGGLVIQRQAGIPTSLISVILGLTVIIFLLRNHYTKKIQVSCHD